MNNNKIIKLVLFLIVIIFSVRCTDDGIMTREYPRVKTLEVNNITKLGAKFNAEILHQGDQEIIEYGFIWDIKENPTIESSDKRVLAEEITTGEFTAKISTTLDQNVNYYVRAYAKNDVYLVYGKNVNFLSLGSEAATIIDFFPKLGTWGDTINIKGKNFSYVAKNNHILFKDIDSEVLSSTDSTIKCIVPKGISDKSVSIYLKVSNQITEANDKFELKIPEIESFSPQKGTFGDKVEIIGNNFSSIKSNINVSFNGHEAEVLSSTENVITVIVPTTVDTQLNKVEVTLNLQSNIAKDQFEILPPKIEDFSPKSGFSKSLITISGNNFNPNKVGDTIFIDSNIGTVIEASKTELTVKVPNDIYINRSFKIGVRVASQTTYSTSKFTLKDPWIRKTDIPYEGLPRYYATGFSILNYGYVGLGLGNDLSENSKGNNDFYKYDPSQDTWKKITNFGGGGRYYATSFVIGNYAYVGSGLISSTEFDMTNDFWKYDPSADNWTEIASLPVNTAKAVGLSVNGYGYLCTPSGTDNFWKYDPVANQWSQLPDLEPIQSGANGRADAGFVIGDKIYIYASGNSTGLHQLYEFDTNTLQWIRRADMIDSGIRWNVVGFSIKGKGYIIDIYYVNEYDPVSDTWKIVEDKPGYSREHGIEFVIDDKAYFGSGLTGGTSINDFWEYNPDY